MQNYYGTFFLCLILVILLFYSIFGILALIFDGVSLCIVKNTLGRDIKKANYQKAFWFDFCFYHNFLLPKYIRYVYNVFCWKW